MALIVDAAKGLDEDTRRILDRLAGHGRRAVLILNKVDRVAAKEKLLALAAEASRTVAFDRVLMISALSGDGVADLLDYLAAAVPAGPWHYPEDEISDLPLRQLAAEITRERLYHRLHEELPYAATVETTVWKELRDGSVRIEQTIFVARESQRAIVLGKDGRTIKQISSEARAELAPIVERPVHLFLFVKVAEGWEGDPERYREMGLDFPSE